MLKMIKVMKVSVIQDQDWHKKLQSKSLLIWLINTLNKMETFSWLFGEGFASNIFSIRIPASSSDSRVTIFRTLKHLEKTTISNIWVERNPITWLQSILIDQLSLVTRRGERRLDLTEPLLHLCILVLREHWNQRGQKKERMIQLGAVSFYYEMQRWVSCNYCNSFYVRHS